MAPSFEKRPHAVSGMHGVYYTIGMGTYKNMGGPKIDPDMIMADLGIRVWL